MSRADFTNLETLRIPVIAAIQGGCIGGAVDKVIHYARDHSVDDGLKQMGWVQGAIWSNAHVREAVVAMKEKRAGSFPDLPELRTFTQLE